MGMIIPLFYNAAARARCIVFDRLQWRHRNTVMKDESLPFFKVASSFHEFLK
jgi:hypothetical protein